MRFREVKKALEAAGWVEQPGGKSGHRHFRHPSSPVKVTVPCHPGDLASVVSESASATTVDSSSSDVVAGLPIAVGIRKARRLANGYRNPITLRNIEKQSGVALR